MYASIENPTTTLAPVQPHSIQKCIPPRKRKSMERRNGGEGGRAESARRGAAFELPRNRSIRCWCELARARRVRSQSGFVEKK